jgi:DnaD/phage-associated family protein
MGKPMLSSAETKKIVNVYSQYALNEEYIITLAAFLNEQNKLTAVRLANDAERLAKKGIDCVEELEIYIAKKTKTSNDEWQYRRFFKIYERPLSDDESARAQKWFGDYGYSEAIIGLAYSITTTNKGGLEIPYMDAILSGWHESGCKTVEDCKAQNEKFKEDWQTKSSDGAETASRPHKKTKAKPRYGDFDVADAFAKALERSYSDSDDENKGD